jgi:primosomal protein N'
MADPAAPATDPAAGAPPPPQVTGINYKTQLTTILGLAPDVSDDEITAKIGSFKTPGDSGNLQTALDTANARVKELETAAQKAQQDEIDELIEEAGELPDDAKTALRNALSTDRASGMALLSAVKKPAAPPTPPEKPAAPATPEKPASAPPAPVHTPKAQAAAMTDQEKVQKQNALIKTVQGEGKFKDYIAARAEARRREPNIFG